MIKNWVENFNPTEIQEEVDQKVILEFIKTHEDYLTRNNMIGHFTSTAWTMNEDMTKVLLAYHNIYNTWSWLGGHADGDANLPSVALREVTEETGVKKIYMPTEDIFSLEVLATAHHEKNGKYVNGHLHLNTTYLVIANEEETLQISENENSDVRWFSLDEVEKYNTEVQMNEIYKKLVKKSKLRR